MSFAPPPARDTEPRRPAGFPPQAPFPPPDDAPARPNLAILVVVGLAALCLSCSIIALAGLAGYNDGARHAQNLAAATRRADADRQYALALTDIATGNVALAVRRLEYVVEELGVNATAAATLLAQVQAVTPSATPTVTLAPTATPQSTATAAPPPTAGPTEAVQETLDPAALFADAQAAYVARDWSHAIEQLEILRGLAPTYQPAETQQMLHDALMQLSRQYLLDPGGERLAEGILLANRAQALGPIGDLAYEAYVAGLYLDARNTEGVECTLAVFAWENVYGEAPQYRDVVQRLFESYVACGNAWALQNEYCPAEGYYNAALTVFNDPALAAQRDQARDLCAQATPTPTPTIEGVPAAPTATP